jgi:hypothetical protein
MVKPYHATERLEKTQNIVVWHFAVICCPCFACCIGVHRLTEKREDPSEELWAARPTIGLEKDVINDGYTPYEEAKPCTLCQRLNIRNILSEEGCFHHDNYASLRFSASYGCKLCTLILLAIERDNGVTQSGRWKSFFDSIQMCPGQD